MKVLLKELWKDESGANAIEYALIAGLVAIILIAALSGDFKDKFLGLFGAMGDKFEDASNELKNSTASE